MSEHFTLRIARGYLIDLKPSAKVQTAIFLPLSGKTLVYRVRRYLRSSKNQVARRVAKVDGGARRGPSCPPINLLLNRHRGLMEQVRGKLTCLHTSPRMPLRREITDQPYPALMCQLMSHLVLLARQRQRTISTKPAVHRARVMVTEGERPHPVEVDRPQVTVPLAQAETTLAEATAPAGVRFAPAKRHLPGVLLMPVRRS